MKRRYSWLNHIINFIAVILGVYLAFYMNEQAKSEKTKEETNLFIASLIKDLDTDIKRYNSIQIPIQVTYQRNLDSLINLLMQEQPEPIEEKLSTLLQVDNALPSSTTYNSMKSAGKLGLLDDFDLRMALSEYYEKTAHDNIKKNEIHADYFLNELFQWLSNNIDFVQVQTLNKDQQRILRNKLMIYQSLTIQKVESYKQIFNESKALKEALESYVNSQE